MSPKYAFLAFIVAAILGVSSRTLADDVGFKVIVHPKNPIGTVGSDFLRNAYLKKETQWSGGATIRPIDLPSKSTPRDRFVRDVIKKTPAQLKTYWNQQIFSGKGVPPPELASTDAVIEYVLANPGAVGYLPSNVDPHGAKVVELR